MKIPRRSEVRDKKVKAKISNLINENYENDILCRERKYTRAKIAKD